MNVKTKKQNKNQTSHFPSNRNRDYPVTAVFFQELMESDLYIFDRDLSILQCVCVCVRCEYTLIHSLKQHSILLSMFWPPGKLTDTLLSKPCQAVKNTVSCQIKSRHPGPHPLFPSPLLPLGFFNAVRVSVLPEIPRL